MSLRSREHQKSLLNVILEVVLISIGVFLALWANNWYEERQHRGLAHSTLRNVADELRANQQAVRGERQYHETLARQLHEFLISNEPLTEERLQKSVQFKGVHPIIFEHTAWDLALATQALSYLKPELAFDISKVYTAQSAFQTLENSFLASAFTGSSEFTLRASPPAGISSDNPKGMATAMVLYLIDVNQQEPAILQLYDKVIPEVNSALSH